MRRIVVVNQKGGCGKTTTAVNLSCCLADAGKRVLLLDLDPQGHAGEWYGLETDTLANTIHEALLGAIDVRQALVVRKENLHILPSNIILSSFEQQMAGMPRREYRLAEILSPLEKDYDFLIVDCPPNLGILTFNALICADEALIPVDPSPFSAKALEKLQQTIELIEDKTGHQISQRILATNIDLRTRYGRQILENLKNSYPKSFLKTFIHSCTRIKEAAAVGVAVGEHDKKCRACRDYSKLAEELPRLKKQGRKKKNVRKMLFTLKATTKGDVQIAGDFNSWRPEPLRLVRGATGLFWQTAMQLSPGSYQYKFLVDGRWLPDPANENTTRNIFGSVNSIITV